MTEEEAQGWIADRFGAIAFDRLKRFVDLLIDENGRQNLIAPSTIPQIWVRHVVDSAQLLGLAPPRWSTWLDIGTGGGFPGVVIAALAPDRSITMVEPRRRRADFLAAVIHALGLSAASARQARVETISGSFDVISARAVAPVGNILVDAAACAGRGTTWILPRGVIDPMTLDDLRSLRSTVFHVEHSITEHASAILVLTGDGR